MTVILLILVLSFLVIIHELGHLFAALWSKVKVEEFGIGYPPKVWTLFTWKNIPFTINAIPFGGFVRMAGEEPGTPHSEKKGEFTAATIPQRLLIVLAGAGVNFLYGIVAFSIMFSILGIPTPIETARIGYVAENSPAAAAELPVGRDIVSMQAPEEESVVMTGSSDVIAFVTEHRGETVQITTNNEEFCSRSRCEVEEITHEAYLRTDEETPQGEGSLGIAFDDYTFRFYPWYEMPFRSSYFGVQQSLLLGREILLALKDLGGSLFSSGSIPTELAGPVGIVDQAQSAGLINEGWLALLSFSAMLSINLAIMNVLPIPPLDGGRAVFIVLEPFFTKKRLERLEYWTNYGGYVFLLGLIVIVTLRDVWRIVSR